MNLSRTQLSRLRSPAHLLLPRRSPELALLLQMLALLQLLLPEVAAQQGVAVLIHPVGEVLAGDADAAALPSLQLPLVNERPLLHADLLQFICTTSGSTARSRGKGLRRAGDAVPRPFGSPVTKITAVDD